MIVEKYSNAREIYKVKSVLIRPTLPPLRPQVLFPGETTGKHCSGYLRNLASQYIHEIGRRRDLLFNQKKKKKKEESYHIYYLFFQ